MIGSLIHRIVHGHWPLPGRVPYPMTDHGVTRVVYGPWYCRICVR